MREPSDLKKVIKLYTDGLIDEDALVDELKNWPYIPMDTNSSPWEADMQYVEGSFDDVYFALLDDRISDEAYDRIIGRWEA